MGHCDQGWTKLPTIASIEKHTTMTGLVQYVSNTD